MFKSLQLLNLNNLNKQYTVLNLKNLQNFKKEFKIFQVKLQLKSKLKIL